MNNMKGNGLMGRNMVLEFIHMLMAINIRASGTMEKSRDKVLYPI